MLQRRSFAKDTNPGLVDVSVACTLAEFFYEPESVPEPSVSACHQAELVRVFVGKGLFVRGLSKVVGGIEQILPVVARLPPDFMPALVAIMTGDDMISAAPRCANCGASA